MAKKETRDKMMKWLNRLDRKIGRFAIPHLMILLSGVMLGIYVWDFLMPEYGIISLLYLDLNLVAQGQVWRLITFLFLPPDTSVLWILFSLYFYCLIGNSLENEWGAFRFNVFYLFGMAGAILAALFTGGVGTNVYLNLSLFLAFAAIYPEFKVMVFFILPIKIKYLALLDLLFLLVMLVLGGWNIRISILMSFLNVLLFFGGDFLRNLKQQAGYWKTRRNFRKYNRR